MSWNDERIALLKKLWSEGLSASQIAALMGGISRSSVIGKVHRLGLSGRQPRKAQNRLRQKAPAGAFGFDRRKKRRSMSDAPKPTGYVDPPIEATDVPTKTIYELNRDDGCCRWRIDIPYRDQPWGFCGKEALPGLVPSLCERHAERSFEHWIQVKHRYVKEEAKELETV